ncbi:NACHT domain-containing protein [Streptomyces sp. NBC_01433]|uniref:NACHT domain-containing protein n=1 Tax=Streptomyces sp. NBC_01433 TaxID=2903864 RepID=UPI00224FF210|nr:NACHT domain-containing protein [Streptomyces sp. NBC_01433]MCX4676327.1 NACHT domain-containing protein [Streptomyces sp. NBC_01433]
MSTPPVSPAARTVVVHGAGSVQGSGVLLTDHLVLTCAHVVKGGSRSGVSHTDLPERSAATVVWIDHDIDAALLRTEEPVLPVGPVRLGVLETDQSLFDCEITGFPDIQRQAGGHLEADQYTVTVLPLAGRVRNLLVCELDGPPPALNEQGLPTLRGLSGGPVFAGNVLLGIARLIPRQRAGRRVECVPITCLVASQPFSLVYRQSGTPLRYEQVRGHYPRDLRYEEEYADAVGAAYRRTKIFGLDELGRHDSEWDLDTAYLSLEAQAPTGRTAKHAPAPPQRIDALLTDRPRVLLRGEAGAGKTTLLWWLAAHASARTLGDTLAPLNGLVPFVVPLRTLRARGGTFPGPAQLADAAALVVDRAPEGWAGRVLESGRALLLVDGLDEVPPDDREQAHSWLSQLLRRYPDTRCVATVRPLAVEPDWLRSEGFEELRLLAMRDEDIQAFVASWHRAARLTEADDQERLDELEGGLSRQFDRNPGLRELARTPLLCAVICALHRRREGFLPETRWKLYRSSLEMLLGHRDRRRRIEDPEGIEMDVEEHTQLLQRLAVWLVREGQSEFTREQALRQLARGLTGMERVSAQGPPEKILTHLLNRSGLLQEHSDDTYQFVHRTFQDFLAAKELVEDDHLNELLRHADEEAWQDVILLAAGHCGRRQLPLLIDGLLKAGERHAEPSEERTDIHVLAALCEQHATWLDSAVRERVRRGTAALFPPADHNHLDSLTRLGAAALPFLPSPESLPSESVSTLNMIDLIGRVGGREALPHARTWARSHPAHGSLLSHRWANFPADDYASEVLAQCDLMNAIILVGREQVSALRHLPALRHLHVSSDVEDAELRTALTRLQLSTLMLDGTALLADLSSLETQAGTLKQLDLYGCLAVKDLTPLAILTSLAYLTIDAMGRPLSLLPPTAHIRSLEHLSLHNVGPGRLSELHAHPTVHRLSVDGGHPLPLDGLEAWESLTSLSFFALGSLDDALAEFRENPRITWLRLRAFPWAGPFASAGTVPSLRILTVPAPQDGEDVSVLRGLFPELTALTLNTSPHTPELDLTPLLAWPGLQVTVSCGFHQPPPLLGSEELGHRLTVENY